ELRAQMQKHFERLAPVLDLEALIAPTDGSADRDVPQGWSGPRLAAPPRERHGHQPADSGQFPIVPPTLFGTRIDPGTVLTAAPIDTETDYPRPFRASWTLPPDRTMMCSNPE